MVIQLKRMTDGNLLMAFLTLALLVGGASVPSGSVARAGDEKPTIGISPNAVKYKATKSINITGSGFASGSLVTLGIEGLGRFRKKTAAKDFWFGLARVKEDRTFAVTIALRSSLWRLKGLSGEYTLVAKNDLGERATAPLLVKKDKPAK